MDTCHCGLSEQEHDGREMDSQNRMHRFNEAVRDSNESLDFGEFGPAVQKSRQDTQKEVPAILFDKPLQQKTKTLLVALLAALTKFNESWAAGKPVKHLLTEMKSLQYRIEESLQKDKP